MNISKITFILLTFVILVSCRKENSEGIDQSEIYTDYRIVYKESEAKTFVRATLKHKINSGENLKLGDDGSVTVEGSNLIWNTTFWRYETEFSGLKDVQIDLEDNEGNKFSNALSFNKVAQYEELSAGNDTLYQDSIQFIPWDNADPIVAGEEVRLVIIQNSNLVVFVNDTVGSTGVYLDGTTLSKLQLGNIDVHFEKWVDFAVNAPNAGGLAKSQTISVTKSVKLIN